MFVNTLAPSQRQRDKGTKGPGTAAAAAAIPPTCYLSCSSLSRSLSVPSRVPSPVPSPVPGLPRPPPARPCRSCPRSSRGIRSSPLGLAVPALPVPAVAPPGPAAAAASSRVPRAELQWPECDRTGLGVTLSSALRADGRASVGEQSCCHPRGPWSRPAHLRDASVGLGLVRFLGVLEEEPVLRACLIFWRCAKGWECRFGVCFC